ncbi:hypothetical protein DFP72DRAFT_1171949 [Ephemerocybe angulata]|uniref:Uncharacterized protein n=1 Tax=Ephemerocybe angulata TaxID=980116 RepID=A0A8H6M1M5_9AGAR|nr:hypothetical protein DFP72DRAFT_1171949 [Tulosesus angulatus]
MRLTNAITIAFSLKLGFYDILDTGLSCLQTFVIPILACRLLLNLRTDDLAVRSIISSLLFSPASSDDGDSRDIVDVCNSPEGRANGITQFLGIGRREEGNSEESWDAEY